MEIFMRQIYINLHKVLYGAINDLKFCIHIFSTMLMLTIYTPLWSPLFRVDTFFSNTAVRYGRGPKLPS